MLDRKIAPQIVDAVDFDLQLQPVEKYILKNGVEVYAIDAGTEDVLQVEWVFDAGNWYEKKNLEAAVANFLLKNGTTSKTAFQINEHFEYYGAYLNSNCGSEYANVTLHCLVKHINELLPVVRDIFSDASMLQAEMDIAILNMKQKLEVNLKKSSFVAGRLIDTYLFGINHPYGRYSRFEDFDALERNDLVHFYNRFYKKGAFKIFVAGKLPGNLFSLLDAYFGDFQNEKITDTIVRVDPSAERRHLIVNDEKSSQASIRMARPFGNRHNPDFLKAYILNVLFGGFFGSRLMANIREDKGYTYGVHSYLLSNKKENAWMVSTEAGRDVSAAAIDEVYNEMDRLREMPVEKDELLLVKNYIMGAILGDLDGPFQLIARWKNIILNDLGEDYFNHTIHTIKTVTAVDLQQIANKYLLPEDFYELTVI